MPVPVAARSKPLDYSRSLHGTVGSNLMLVLVMMTVYECRWYNILRRMILKL